MVFDLNKTLESEIEQLITNNIPINNKEDYYIKQEKGSNLFVIRSMRKNSEAVIANAFINPDKFLNVPLLFDLDVAIELEIENWIVKSIKYWLENVKNRL